MFRLINRVSFILLVTLSGCREVAGNSGEAGTSIGEAPVSDTLAECNNEPVKRPNRLPIVHGTYDPTLFNISKAQQNAVGSLMKGSGLVWRNHCTATLIAPKVVLTAAHCLLDENTFELSGNVDNYRFAVGLKAATKYSPQLFAAASFAYNPKYDGETSDHDQAIFIMEDDIPAVSTVAIKPIEINWQRDLSWLKDEIVQTVGYGATSATSYSNVRKYWTTEPVESISEGYFTVDGYGYSSVCFGDSGGPALYRMSDGVLRVMGTVSSGDESCVGIDEFSRIDANLSWLKSVAGRIWGCANLPGGSECTENGVARWCADDGKDVLFENCQAKGLDCLINKNGQAKCGSNEVIDQPDDITDADTEEDTDSDIVNQPDSTTEEISDCQLLGWKGKCFGDIAIWCQDGQIVSRDCAKCGQSCGRTLSMGSYCR